MPARWQTLAAAAGQSDDNATTSPTSSAPTTRDSQQATTSKKTWPEGLTTTGSGSLSATSTSVGPRVSDSVLYRKAVYVLAKRRYDRVSDTVRNPEAWFDRVQSALLEQLRPLTQGVNEAEFSSADEYADFLNPPVPVSDVPERHATTSTGPCHVCDGNHWLYVNEEQNLVVRCNACGGRGEPMPQPEFNEVQRQRNREKLVALMRQM